MTKEEFLEKQIDILRNVLEDLGSILGNKFPELIPSLREAGNAWTSAEKTLEKEYRK